MFKFIKLKSTQGPWGPWTKRKEEEKESENFEEIKNSGDNSDQEPPKNDRNNDDDDNKKDEKISDNSDKTTENKEETQEKEEKTTIFAEEIKNEEIEEEPVNNPWASQQTKGQNTDPKYDKIIKDLISNRGGGSGGGSNNNGSNFGDDFVDNLLRAPKKFISLIVLALLSIWLLSGFYKVDSDENAIILYFGKFYGIATPGLNYHIPYPVGKVVKQSITAVNSEEFGYNSPPNNNSNKRFKNSRSDDVENLMLTGDENIVDIEFQVQWQINDIEEYTFNISNPKLTIRQAAQSAMREIIAKTPISEALSDGKYKIEQEVKLLLQQTLDSYSSGIRVVLVQLRRVDPPAQVIDAFRDVQTAKADKEREINESQAYANDIIPRARGNAAEMEEKAKAYKQKVEAGAIGESKRFLALYYQYKNAKDVTRKRMYLDTMKKVYGDIDKVIIGENAANGSLFPYLPINDLNKNQDAKNIKNNDIKNVK